MKKIKIKKQPDKKFVGYEDARENKNGENLNESSEKSVKAATNRLHPDENSMDRG